MFDVKKKFTVLVVDDEPNNLEVLGELLNTEYRVLVANNAETGLTLALSQRPDLILLDILMPNLNGFDACSLLKSSPKTQHIPIIFLTALDDIKDKVRGLELGAVDYVTKPFQLQELLSRINVSLKISQLTKKLKQKNEILIQEIKARKNVELELKKSEERLKTIINNNLNGMLVVDYDGKILFVNKEAENLFKRKK